MNQAKKASEMEFKQKMDGVATKLQGTEDEVQKLIKALKEERMKKDEATRDKERALSQVEEEK